MTILLTLALLLLPLAQPSGFRNVAAQLEGGGDVAVRRAVDALHVTVTGPRAGLASLCVGNESRVRILHASAAVGDALYERTGDAWVLKRGFEWKLRDSGTDPPAAEASDEFFATSGWTANPSRTGAPRRDFTIALSADVRFVGVAFLSTGDPMAVSHWPSSIDDDCRAVKVAQGYLPETARFTPQRWHKVQ
jgi:hypothetical protein